MIARMRRVRHRLLRWPRRIRRRVYRALDLTSAAILYGGTVVLIWRVVSVIRHYI